MGLISQILPRLHALDLSYNKRSYNRGEQLEENVKKNLHIQLLICIVN